MAPSTPTMPHPIELKTPRTAALYPRRCLTRHLPNIMMPATGSDSFLRCRLSDLCCGQWFCLASEAGSSLYILSLLLGAAGFIMTAFFTNQWLLFVAFVLIGCAWAAMLAWPFTILTNSLKGGNIGAYLGLFNCTICIPQIVAAIVGGWILSMLSTRDNSLPSIS